MMISAKARLMGFSLVDWCCIGPQPAQLKRISDHPVAVLVHLAVCPLDGDVQACFYFADPVGDFIDVIESKRLTAGTVGSTVQNGVDSPLGWAERGVA